MAESGASDESGKPKGGMIQTVAAVVILTLLAGGGGAAMGMLTAKPGPAEAALEPQVAGPAPEGAARLDAHGNTDEAKTTGAGAGAGAGAAPGAKGEAKGGEAAPKLVLVPLDPVLTNIYAPANTWLRVEASLVLRDDGSENPQVLAAEVQADTLAFLRSVQLAQIEGTRGLMHLRDDLRDRAKLRSPAVVDYLIKTLVAE